MRPLAAALLAVALSACLVSPMPDAAATLSAEPIAVGPFHRLDVSGHAEVVLVQGDRETVTVEASPRSPTRVRVQSSGGRVRISAEDERGWSFGFHAARPPTITVHFRTLDTLGVAGAVKLQAAAIDTPSLAVTATGGTSFRIDQLKTSELRFTGSGAVKGEIEGTATDQQISISGAGTFRGPKLVSDNVRATVSGAGRVIVNAQKTLAATISGAGAIDYYGDPALKQRITGAGKITRRGFDAAPAGARTA
jgi:hypothetical protein